MNGCSVIGPSSSRHQQVPTCASNLDQQTSSGPPRQKRVRVWLAPWQKHHPTFLPGTPAKSFPRLAAGDDKPWYPTSLALWKTVSGSLTRLLLMALLLVSTAQHPPSRAEGNPPSPE